MSETSNPHCRRTRDTITESDLRELFTMDENDGPLDEVEATHDGEWRKEAGGVWRWWELPEDMKLGVECVGIVQEDRT